MTDGPLSRVEVGRRDVKQETVEVPSTDMWVWTEGQVPVGLPRDMYKVLTVFQACINTLCCYLYSTVFVMPNWT